MSNTASNVSTGKPKIGGAVFVADTGAALPTDASTALTSFTSLGYCSDAGLTNDNTISTTNIVAWGGDTVASEESGKTDTFGVTLIEALNVDVLKEIYTESNVTGTLATGITVKANNTPHEKRAWVVDMIMTNNAAKRIVIPSGKITSVGTITYADSSAIGYTVTITAYPDSEGNTHYEYIKGASTNAIE